MEHLERPLDPSALLAPAWWPGALPFELAGFLLVALAISAAGFKRVVYFVSTGYAFSVAAIAVLSLGLFRATATPLAVLHTLGILAYGLRLGWFLLQRERRPSYRPELVEIDKRGSRITLPMKFVIWLSVALLYVVMVTPAIYGLLSPAQGALQLGLQSLGLVLMVAGLTLESVADRQKSRYKTDRPAHYCDVKLYRFVRCPNYLAEMVVWLGVFVAGLHAYDHWLRWGTAVVGFVCIQLIMVGSAGRLERIQNRRYGGSEDYQAYVARVPVLLPWVPVYSLQKWRIYLG